MMALGLAAGAIAAHLGLSRAAADRRARRSSAAARRRCGTGAGHAESALGAGGQNRDVNLDIGERVHVDEWAADGTARVTYRGSPAGRHGWRLAPRRCAGEHEVVAVEGNWLVLAPLTCADRETESTQETHYAWPSHSYLPLIAVIFIVQTFKIVPQQHAWVVERLGKYDRTLTPGLELRHAVRRPRRLQALAEGGAARRAEPGLHHQGQHAAAGRRHHLLPGDRPDARELRLEQLRARDHAAGADAAALRDRQDGARQDVRGARRDQRVGRERARRGGRATGASRCCATRSRT